jgi:hypothetical protein
VEILRVLRGDVRVGFLSFAETTGLEEAIGLSDCFGRWLWFFVVPRWLHGGI